MTDQDFALYLYRLDGKDWTYVTSADDPQTGTQPPIERLTYTVTMEARYAVAIYKMSANTSPTFILRNDSYEFYYFGYNNYTDPAPGSLTCPGDAASCLTVGAINYAKYTNGGPIERFSSLGPNNGAYTGNPTVVKPDICGPDRVSTVTYGATAFSGTSATAPHIAGLAALVKSAFPAYNNTQLRNYLESHGVDLGAAGKDNTYGYGPCVLPAPPVVNQPPTLAPISNLTTNEDAGLVTVSLTGISAGGGENQTLTVTATSGNTALIPNPTVTYTSPDTTGTLTFAPVTNASGTAIITVIVRDNGGTANGGVDSKTNTFSVSVTVTQHAQTASLYASRDFGVATVNPASALAPLDATSADSSTLAITNRVFCVRWAGLSPTNLLLIEASSNLVDWVPVLTNTMPGNSFLYTDLDSGKYAWRFYRAIQFPRR